MLKKHLRMLIGLGWGALSLSSITGCSVAVPTVTSLVTPLTVFKLLKNEIRISNISELSSLSITAQCNSFSTSFEYQIPDIDGSNWHVLPSTSDSIFTVTNNCAINGTLTLAFDLSSVSFFNTMAAGDAKNLKFRDQNIFNASRSDILKITYSNFTLSDNKIIYGHGFTNLKTSGSFSLQGRASKIQELPQVTSGAYILTGKAVFQ